MPYPVFILATKNLSAERIPFQDRFLLRWSIFPVNCPFDPLLLVATYDVPSKLM